MFCKIISITNQKEKRSYPDKKRLKSIKFYSFQSIFIRDKVKKFILEMGKHYLLKKETHERREPYASLCESPLTEKKRLDTKRQEES